MPTISAHCLVKNEEKFVRYAVKSVIDFVDQIIIFDTGSTDSTVKIICDLQKEYSGKIIFKEKGVCDKDAHTRLRQEMLDITTTDWFMILDGDEVWTKRGMQEAVAAIQKNSVGCIVAPYYLCVGDIFHHSIRGKYILEGIKAHASPRFFKRVLGLSWNTGPYGIADFIQDEKGNVIRKNNYIFLKEKYWHASALVRSNKDEEVGLGRHKQVITYSLKILGEGLRIREPIPEAFGGGAGMKLPLYKSLINLFLFILFKLKFVRKRIWI